jgi:hypothetical protein
MRIFLDRSCESPIGNGRGNDHRAAIAQARALG